MAQDFGTTQGFGTTPVQGPTTGAAREWTLAVDFGTSNTAAAHTTPLGGAVETLQLSHTGATMPSAVFVASPEEIVVGDHARDRAESYPPGYVPSPKRSLGQGVVQVAGYEVPAARLVAAVLRAVLERACAAHGGSAPTRLVLTHPEAWLPREVQVLTDAAGLLGLPSSTEVTTVSEPRAAARYYAGGRGLEPGRLVAVFDFGGGTLDVAVLRADDAGDVEVVAARGDDGLGGRTLDAAVRGWVDRQLGDQLGDDRGAGRLGPRAPAAHPRRVPGARGGSARRGGRAHLGDAVRRGGGRARRVGGDLPHGRVVADPGRARAAGAARSGGHARRPEDGGGAGRDHGDQRRPLRRSHRRLRHPPDARLRGGARPRARR